MPSDSPDFEAYSTAELREVLELIDEDQYPERVQRVRELLAQRERADQNEQPEPTRPDGQRERLTPKLQPWLGYCLALYVAIFSVAALDVAIDIFNESSGLLKLGALIALVPAAFGFTGAAFLARGNRLGFLFSALFFLPQTIEFVGDDTWYRASFGFRFDINPGEKDGLNLIESAVVFFLLSIHFFQSTADEHARA